MHPPSDDSLLFHHPNIRITKYLAEAMQIPLVELGFRGRTKDDEVQALEDALVQAKDQYRIEGVVSGGISSRFQKHAFDQICSNNGLESVAPIWGLEPEQYMCELLKRGFKIMIVSVSALGLGKEWLGTVLDTQSLGRLAALGRKYGFNLNFEGGEAETLVLDCPLYRSRLQVLAADTHWDGQRGIFEIREAALVAK